MRLDMHHKIGKTLAGELKELGFHIHEGLFLLGNLFPDLVYSFLWRRHEYQYTREYVRRKMRVLKNKPWLFSFHLGILAHYICDYFCYPHSNCYEKGLIQHILYEIRQKVPKQYSQAKLHIKAFSIEELDHLVTWYENFRAFFDDDESDFHMAAMVSSGFLQAAY